MPSAARPPFAPSSAVTTDKCYENKEWLWGYRESDPLGGYDPLLQSSKACAEIVSAAYRQSYFHCRTNSPTHKCRRGHRPRPATSSAEATGPLDRLIPDLVRGFLAGESVLIRRPHSIRPWQHVLEPLAGYIALAEKLLSDEDRQLRHRLQLRPLRRRRTTRTAGSSKSMVGFWGDNSLAGSSTPDPGVHEAGYLKLDASRARGTSSAGIPRLRPRNHPRVAR